MDHLRQSIWQTAVQFNSEFQSTVDQAAKRSLDAAVFNGRDLTDGPRLKWSKCLSQKLGARSTSG
jgi:hypothetical protein